MKMTEQLFRKILSEYRVTDFRTPDPRIDFTLLPHHHFKMFLPEVFFINFYFYSMHTRIFDRNFKAFELSISYAKFWKIISFNFIFSFFIG